MTASGVSFGVLGPLEVRVHGRKMTPPGRVVRRLFAALLLAVDQPVEDERLVAWTWGPQRAARGALHTAAYRLRSWLVETGSLTEPLVHDSAGYRLNIPPEAVDAGRFRMLVRAAADREDPAGRVEDLEAALALWRGPILADLPEWTRDHPEVAVLERERVAASCALADAAVAAGRPSESTVRELERLAAELPYDETVQARWLTLLGARGQRAEALRSYEGIRRRLAEDLGVDPSADLRAVHLALLADPEAGAPVPPAAAREPAAGAVRPRMLPRRVPDFTGRAEQVERLLTLAAEPRPDRIVVLDGMAGVGKTSTALHVAHRLESDYPDGAIFLDLHGYTADQHPVEPAAALHSLLRGIGVPGDRIPDELDCRAALWRSKLSTRRLIVILDNAASASQIRPLLPGPTPSLVLVTSRRRLAGLDGVEVFSLDPLPPDDADRLFASIVGRRAIDEPDAAREVVSICGHLPLAIRIAAVRLQHRPAWRVADLVHRLRDENRRLAELTAEDRSVAAAFALSYRELRPDQQRTFRLLGLIPGEDVNAQAAAALLGTSVSQATTALDELVDTHLLQEPTPGRYRFHDLVRQHAAEATATGELEAERQAAVRRLLDYYVHTAEEAATFVEPVRLRTDSADIPMPQPGPQPSDSEEALAWLIAEYDNIVAAAYRAGAVDLPLHAWHLVQAVTALCRHRGQFNEGMKLHEFALTMARRRSDKRREGMTHLYLAGTYWAHGRIKDAFVHCEAAITFYRATGDRDSEVRATSNLGLLYEHLGEYSAALECYRFSLERDLVAGSVREQAIGLARIGSVLHKLGDHEQARQHVRRALGSVREVEAPWGEAEIHGVAGLIHRSAGRYEEARSAYETALLRLRAAPAPAIEGACLGGLGVTLARLGQHDESRRLCAQGLDLLRGADAKPGLVTLLNDVGRLHEENGELCRSGAMFHEALTVAREASIPYEQARALEGLGNAAARIGDQRMALDRWSDALRLFENLGVPDAERVASRIAEASGEDTRTA